MQSSIWKIVAAIGIVGIGTLVVLEVQHRLPTAQSGGLAPGLSASQLAEFGEKSVVPDAETELDRMLSGTEVSDSTFSTDEPPFSAQVEPAGSGGLESSATLVMAPVDNTVNRSQLFEGESPFQSTEVEPAANESSAGAASLAFGNTDSADDRPPAFSDEPFQAEKSSEAGEAPVRTASFTSEPDASGAVGVSSGAVGVSGQRNAAGAAARISDNQDFFGSDAGQAAASGNSQPASRESDLPVLSDLNESPFAERASAAATSRQTGTSAGNAADEATPNLMFFGEELGKDSSGSSGTTSPLSPSDSIRPSGSQPRDTGLRNTQPELANPPAEPTLDFFSDDGAVPVPQPVGGRPETPNTPDASPFDLDPVQPPRDVPSRSPLERPRDGSMNQSGAGNGDIDNRGAGDSGREAIDFPTLEELPVPEISPSNPTSRGPSENPFSFPDETERPARNSGPANPVGSGDAFPDAFEADGPQLDRPQLDRPEFDRPEFDRPQLDRPEFDRPQLDRPEFDRPEPDRRFEPRNPVQEEPAMLPGFDGGAGRDSEPAVDTTDSAGMTETMRPHVSIRKTAPDTASVGVPMDYTIVVMNEGQTPAYDVEIEDQLGRGINLVTTRPTSDSFDRSTGRMTWLIAELAAGEKREITVRVNPVSEGTMDGVATVRFKTQVKATTVITAPRLSMELTGPEEVRVGDEINFRFVVRNEGSGEATNVILRSVLPAALRHAEGQDLEYEIASLKPSEEREILLTVLASEKTTTSVRAEVSTAGLATATAETSIHVVGEQLTVERLGPERRYVNRPAQFQNIVTNSTNFEAVNAVVLEKVAEGMKFVSAPGGEYNPQTRVITWRLERVAPGKQVLLDVELLPETAGDKDTIVEVVENAGFRAQVSRTIAVEDLHNVSADISRLDGPVAVGEKFDFTITIDNRGTATANEVQLTVQVPSQIRILAAGSKEQGITARLGKGNIVVYNPVVKVEPNQVKTFQLVLQGQESVRNGVVKAQLKYAEMQEPLVVSESVTVYSDSL